MDYARLGGSELVSSVIGLGGGSSSRFGLVKGATKSDAVTLIRTAVDEGITFFDGAGICGGVDELLAEALADCRDRVLISTKVHIGPAVFPFARMRRANQVSSWIARRSGWSCSAGVLRKRVEQSLRTLRTDRIDILHLHAVSPQQYSSAVARVVPELLRMKDEGKLRMVGITEGFLTDPGHSMLSAALDDSWADAMMVGFSLQNSSAARVLIPRAKDKGVSVIGMFALRGLLKTQDGEEGIALAELLEEAGAADLSELAYRYCRHQDGIDVVLTGTGNAAHLRQNIAAALAPPLPDSVLERLDQLWRDQMGVSTR
jgi:L-galactose dehydrogenase